MNFAVIAVEGTEALDQAVVVIAVTATKYRAALLANAYTADMNIETLVRDIKTGDIVYCSDTVD